MNATTTTPRFQGARIKSAFVYIRTANGAEYMQEITAAQGVNNAVEVLAAAVQATPGQIAEAFVGVRWAAKGDCVRGSYGVAARA